MFFKASETEENVSKSADDILIPQLLIVLKTLITFVNYCEISIVNLKQSNTFSLKCRKISHEHKSIMKQMS